jgi:hypothetical protein
MISRIHIFAPGTAGMVDRRVWPLDSAGAGSGISPSIVRLNVLRCGSIAGHTNKAGSPVGSRHRIPTVAGCGGKFDLPIGGFR